MKGSVLVTGGASAVGAAICRKLATNGHNLAIHYNRSEGQAQEVVDECHGLGVSVELVQGDFSSEIQTQQFLDLYTEKGLEVTHIVFNHSFYLEEGITETAHQLWQRLFQINVHSVHQLCSALLPQLERHQGSITALGVSGLDGARSHGAAYCASVAARLSLMRSLALSLAASGARANMVSPGQLDNSVDFDPERLGHLPMGKPGNVEEIARVVAFLIDPASSYITGQNIEVAGGNRLI